MMFINEQGISRMNDDEIIRQRIAGKSVRAIAKTQRRSVAEINTVIDRWASVALTAEAASMGSLLSLPGTMSCSGPFMRRPLGATSRPAPCAIRSLPVAV
jgi:hypothetical protein